MSITIYPATLRIIPIEKEGTIDQTMVNNLNSQQLLSDLLKEQKKMNLQLMFLTDNDIKNTEIE